MIHPNVSFFSGQYWRHTLISAAVLAALICTVAGAFGQPRIPMRPQKATIIVDSADKTKIRGFTSIAMVWGKQVKQPYKDITSSVINLATAMNNWTEVYTTGFNNMTLSSDVLLDVPFCIMTTEEEFELTMPELSNVRKYLQSGGFIFCDNAIGTVHSSPVQKSFKAMIRDALGDNVEFRPIPKDHELYNCFFEFEDGVPIIRSGNIINYGPFEGAWYDDRMVGIYSNMANTIQWSESSENILQLKMGVNLIIFALTREGSMSRR